MLTSQAKDVRKRSFAVLLLFLLIGSLPMAYENQMIYAVFTAALLFVLMVASATYNHNIILTMALFLVSANGFISVFRGIIRPYEAMSIFGLYFLYFLWKKHPQVARWLAERLGILLIFITYAAVLSQAWHGELELLTDNNVSGVFFERGIMSIFLFLAALNLNSIYRMLVMPILIISGSVFGLFAAITLGFLVFNRYKVVTMPAAVLMLCWGLTYYIFTMNSSFWLASMYDSKLPIVQRLVHGEVRNINTRSLARAEYYPIQSFYYEPTVGKLLWGLGSQDVASGVPHNKLAELGLVSFTIFKFWEFLLLYNLASRLRSFEKIILFAVWLMLSGYVFYLFIPGIFFLLAAVFQKSKNISNDKVFTVNKRKPVNHAQ